MLQLGVDQFTLVLQSKLDYEYEDWGKFEADLLVDDFMERSKMRELIPNEFGSADVKLPDGYTHGYSFHDSLWYWTIAYHEYFRRMGVIIKFSAYAWHEYRKRYEQTFGETVELYGFLKMTQSNLYSQRLSRVDIYVDFIDEGIDVAQLKRSFESGRLEVRYGKY